LWRKPKPVSSVAVTDERAIGQLFESALRHHRAGELAEAEPLYRAVLSADPDRADALQMLGMLAQQSGRGAEAIELLARAVQQSPQSPTAHYNFAKVLADNGHAERAIEEYREALRLQPDWPPAWNNLGNLLNAADQTDAAIDAYRRCLNLNPNYAEAHYNLGTALQKRSRWAEAADELRKAIALRPNYPDAFNNLGIVLGELDRIDEAIETYRQGLSLQPVHEGLNSNLGAALRSAGQIPEAVAAFRRATMGPCSPKAASNLLYAMLLDPAYDQNAVRDACQQWDLTYAVPLRSQIPPNENDRSPERRLRIGYVSPDLGNHPVGRFMAPLLANHDHEKFEIFCYCDHAQSDPISRRNRAHADQWRLTRRVSDPELVEIIRRDRIDILVDLVMHTSNNRLMAFARKPAPVQVSYLAYPGATGLETIDYRLTDPYLDPPESGVDNKAPTFERAFALPHSFWCYSEPPEAEQVGQSPALRMGHVTFGCLNNFGKISEPILEAWIRILRDMPGSRLLLHACPGSHRQRLSNRVRGEGIDPDRLRFVAMLPTPDYFRQYHQIDIALDTFPYAGGTTTCDALWMGVPVVTLVGSRPISRGGASILSNIGLPDLIAGSLEEYSAIAVRLAADPSRLAGLRARMRQQMRASPLMNAPRFARDIEAAYRQMWRTWCTNSLE
jgi:predicted O-linked N-acetylglucosamine transferase (SPINDLY family)